jgi:hypothetical protein
MTKNRYNKKFISFVLILVPFTILLLILIGMFTGNINFVFLTKQSSVDSTLPLVLPFSDKIKSQLFSYYNTNYEYSACMDSYSDDLFNIRYISNYRNGTNVFVNSFYCSTTSQIHSHVNGDCSPSNKDILSWKNMVKQGVVIFYIQCAPNRVAVYTQENLGLGVEYEI